MTILHMSIGLNIQYFSSNYHSLHWPRTQNYTDFNIKVKTFELVLWRFEDYTEKKMIYSV